MNQPSWCKWSKCAECVSCCWCRLTAFPPPPTKLLHHPPPLISTPRCSSMYPSLISVASGPREVLQDFGISGQCPALCRAALISLEPARGPAAWLGTVSSGAAPPVGSQAPASPNPPPPPTSPNVNLWDNLEWGTLFFLEEEPSIASK